MKKSAMANMKSKSWREQILIPALFVLFSLVATYPLIFRFRSSIYGGGGDSLWAVWSFWWARYAHLNNFSFSFCSLVSSPFGENFSQLPVSIGVVSISKWLPLLTGEIFAYNFLVFISFPLAAIITYYLVFHFTKNRIASIFSGIIYAFSPYHFVHASQHWGLANIQWIPLFFLALFNLDEKRTYGSAILAALVFSLIFFSNYYYGYFITIFTGVFILWRVWQGLRNKRLSGYPVTRLSGEKKNRLPITDYRSPLKTVKVVLVAVVVALAIILPAIYPILKNVFRPETEVIASLGYKRAFSGLFTYSAQFFHYLIPSGDNPFIGGFTRNFIKVYHPVEQTLYLGWVGIILSIVAIREWRRKNALMRNAKCVHAISNQAIEQSSIQHPVSSIQHPASSIQDQGSRIQKAVSFFLFAGIAALIFSHTPWTDIGPFRIFFPSYFLYKIAPMFRVYARFGILVMLSVSVLAGIGLAGILQKIKTPKKQKILFAVIILFIFLEFAPTFPAPMVNAVDPPPVYEWLARQPGDFTIAEYPLEGDSEYFFWQRIHQKRLINGALPGTYADKIRKEIIDILDPKTPGILKHLGAKYVIFHSGKYAKSEEVAIIGEIPDVQKQLGLRLVKLFPEAEVYEIITPPIKPKTNHEE